MLVHLYFIESAFCPGLKRLVRTGKAQSLTAKIQLPTSAQWLALKAEPAPTRSSLRFRPGSKLHWRPTKRKPTSQSIGEPHGRQDLPSVLSASRQLPSLIRRRPAGTWSGRSAGVAKTSKYLNRPLKQWNLNQRRYVEHLSQPNLATCRLPNSTSARVQPTHGPSSRCRTGFPAAPAQRMCNATSECRRDALVYLSSSKAAS